MFIYCLKNVCFRDISKCKGKYSTNNDSCQVLYYGAMTKSNCVYWKYLCKVIYLFYGKVFGGHRCVPGYQV